MSSPKIRLFAIVVLAVTIGSALCANYLAPVGYEHQFRETPGASPSAKHLLGTDDLGRDRFARLLYGARVSLLLAPLAAALSTLLAAFFGGMAGYFGGWIERVALVVVDLFLSIPWLFLLISVRAVLPLNISPQSSVVVTFLLLGFLGWAVSARVVCAGTRELMKSEFVTLARATGFSGSKLVRLHVLPNLRGILLAQFWISVPVFILTEANLGALGLGVSEPLPSLGSLLRELQNVVTLRPEPWRFIPLVVLVLVVSCFEVLLNSPSISSRGTSEVRV
ncbi:MAG TPA: ABC transporter permease [Candidatus Angelobacter sp.]|nr:ABC transporter permease [Candidatus Angelobacter sp.]